MQPPPHPRSVKVLGEADSDGEESALSWVDKMRQKEEEKKMAEERVCWGVGCTSGINWLRKNYLFCVCV